MATPRRHTSNLTNSLGKVNPLVYYARTGQILEHCQTEKGVRQADS